MASDSTPQIPRRVWMQLMGVLAAAPALKGQTPAPTPPAQRVSKEQVVAALATLGLVFTDPQIDMLMPTANRLFTQYETAARRSTSRSTRRPPSRFHP
jgi:hypothetical protein